MGRVTKLTILHRENHETHQSRLEAALDPELRCNVYRNLHTGLWSVRQGGIVKLHTDVIRMKDVRFNVSKRGRELVIKEQRKNVHATISGVLATCADLNALPGKSRAITYDPYKYRGFVDVDSLPVEMVLSSASGVDMDCNCSIAPPVIAWGINS